MRFEFKLSFDRSIKQLPPNDKAEVKVAASQLIDYKEKVVCSCFFTKCY